MGGYGKPYGKPVLLYHIKPQSKKPNLKEIIIPSLTLLPGGEIGIKQCLEMI
jgi:hypothetical protein